jgi:hypothetical protein
MSWHLRRDVYGSQQASFHQQTVTCKTFSMSKMDESLFLANLQLFTTTPIRKRQQLFKNASSG